MTLMAVLLGRQEIPPTDYPAIDPSTLIPVRQTALLVRSSKPKTLLDF